MSGLKSVGLTRLMGVTRGRADTLVGLIDGPVDIEALGAVECAVRSVSNARIACTDRDDFGCRHGTLLATALVGRGEGSSGGMCPGCTLVLRPIFSAPSASGLPESDAMTLAAAIVDTVEAGASVINLSLSVSHVGRQASLALSDAVDFACARGSIVVAASGNAGELGSSALTAHPWVIPVVACDDTLALMPFSNLGRSIGRQGLGAPGLWSYDAGSGQGSEQVAGTSVAAVFVTAAAALLRSAFPMVDATAIVRAMRPAVGGRRAVVPPLLDAWASYERLLAGRH